MVTGCNPASSRMTVHQPHCVSPALFNIDRRLLFYTRGSYIFKPRQQHSPYPAITALLILLGGVETNPGPAAKLNHESASFTTISSGYLNCRSTASKIALIHDLINDSKIDVLFLSETWFTLDTLTSLLRDVAPPGYAALHVVRPTGPGPPARGGGLVAVFIILCHICELSFDHDFAPC